MLIPSASASPEDEGPEGHAYYLREGEPQNVDDIEGTAYQAGSG